MGDLFETLGRAHTLGILHLFFSPREKPWRFVEIQGRLGLSPNTLSERLNGLVDSGLLQRTVYGEIPPRVEYEATRKLRELEAVFDQLEGWARRNDLAPEMAAAPSR